MEHQSTSDKEHHCHPDARGFLRAALDLAQRQAPFADFLGALCRALSEQHPFNSTEVWARAHGKEIGCSYIKDADRPTILSLDASGGASGELRRWYQRLAGDAAVPKASRTAAGGAWVNTSLAPAAMQFQAPEQPSELLVLVPFGEPAEASGLLVLKDRHYRDPDLAEISHLELLAESLGTALAVRRTQTALTERIKELTCLYRLALLAETPGTSLEDLLKGVVELLPDAYLYADDAWARIELDGVCYGECSQEASDDSLRAPIIVLGVRRGSIQVAYRSPKPTLDQGPFLREEKSLLDTVAREVALLVERKQREAESRALEEQLRHADRLATIGELAAGLAHELNEPLANILGFAQLAGRGPRLPRQTKGDIDKIVQAALHARGLTQQLLLFARRMPQNRAQIDLNRVVIEALRLLEPLFDRERVEVVRQLSPSPLEINADGGQIRQVIVNLAVNAVQAMPNGGRLTIRTAAEQAGESATLTIEDKGIGMSEEVLKKIFLPFFTTKEADRGTGLGLAVVHGIVTSHGGRIEVQSRESLGTRFEVFLPLCPAGRRE